MSDQKTDLEKTDCETLTHNMGIKMGVQVHCHDCWKYTDAVNYKRDLVRSAVDIIQSSGISGKECYTEANNFLASAFAESSGHFESHKTLKDKLS